MMILDENVPSKISKPILKSCLELSHPQMHRIILNGQETWRADIKGFYDEYQFNGWISDWEEEKAKEMKEKGNAAFKKNKNKEAEFIKWTSLNELHFLCRQLHPGYRPFYTNQAIVRNKTKKYEEALLDCDSGNYFILIRKLTSATFAFSFNFFSDFRFPVPIRILPFKQN